MRFFLPAVVVSVLVPQVGVAQDAESLRDRIEEHYRAIHADNTAEVRSHHLSDMSIFPPNGHLLMEPGWEDATARMGTEPRFPESEVAMRHFSAQIYDDVGIALFYLDGIRAGEPGTWRVTAVWVWRDGEWLEAHHHESRLVS